MQKERLTVLADQARRGDREALSGLLELCYQDLFYCAYATVKNEDIAADATQESCMEILSTIEKLREPEAFMTWARRIVYHKCARHFRQTQMEVPIAENEDGESILDRLPDENPQNMPEQLWEDREFRLLMQQLLEELPEAQRSALMYYYYERLSVGQIAEIQDTTEGTVKSRLNYGRKAMKEKVERYEKKTGIRLYSISGLPVLLYLLFRQEAMQVAGQSTGVLAGIGEAISGASGGSAAAGAGTAAATGTAATGTAAAVGVSLGVKIVTGIVAAVLALGVATGIALSKNKPPVETPEVQTGETENRQICQEICQMFQGLWVREDFDQADPETYFIIHTDGKAEYNGNTYYIQTRLWREPHRDSIPEETPREAVQFTADAAGLYDEDAEPACECLFWRPAELGGQIPMFDLVLKWRNEDGSFAGSTKGTFFRPDHPGDPFPQLTQTSHDPVPEATEPATTPQDMPTYGPVDPENIQACTDVAKSLQGNWVSEYYDPARPITWFKLNPDGSMEFDGYTYYLCKTGWWDSVGGQAKEETPREALYFTDNPNGAYNPQAEIALRCYFWRPVELGGERTLCAIKWGFDKSDVEIMAGPAFFQPNSPEEPFPQLTEQPHQYWLGKPQTTIELLAGTWTAEGKDKAAPENWISFDPFGDLQWNGNHYYLINIQCHSPDHDELGPVTLFYALEDKPFDEWAENPYELWINVEWSWETEAEHDAAKLCLKVSYPVDAILLYHTAE